MGDRLGGGGRARRREQTNHPSPAGPQATVLEMALAGCGIANDGAIMQPYLVDGIYNADGKRSYTATPKKLSQAVSADTASRVRKALPAEFAYIIEELMNKDWSKVNETLK